MVNSTTAANSVGNSSLLPTIEKKAILKHLFVALFAAVTTSSAFAQLNTTISKSTSGNLTSSTSEQAWSNGTNELCWRSSFWTPENANSKCDAAAIKASAKLLTSQRVTYQGDALFSFDSAYLSAKGQSKLNDLIAKSKHFNNIQAFIVTGHTDTVGTDEYNNDLSKRRAEAVKHYLVSKGLDPQRIFVKAKGKTEPITKGCTQIKNGKASNDEGYIACLSPDRRVVVDVVTSNGK